MPDPRIKCGAGLSGMTTKLEQVCHLLLKGLIMLEHL